MPEVRLIDANAEVERLKSDYCKDCTRKGNYVIFGAACTPCWVKDAVEEFEDAPTIEAEPVRHGHWVHHSDVKTWEEWETCSNCGEKRPIDYDEYRDGAFGFANGCFCNSCGTKMDSTDTNDGGKGGADNG